MNARAWSFPEPEKTTAWKDEPKEPRINLRDSDLERAEKRSKLIRERMSPPGALHLPPLLEANRLKYGIPDGAFKSQASFDRIYVFPIDPFEGEQTYTGTTIIKPNLTKLKDFQEGHRGVLISAGLTAADRLMSHGIELGHVVTTNKNVPFARRCEQLETFDIFYLVMRDGDLAGSETLAEERLADRAHIVDVGGESGYSHQIARPGPDGEWSVKKKQSVYVNDTW